MLETISALSMVEMFTAIRALPHAMMQPGTPVVRRSYWFTMTFFFAASSATILFSLISAFHWPDALLNGDLPLAITLPPPTRRRAARHASSLDE